MYNTYLKYVFITSTLCIQLCLRYTKIHCTMYFSVSGPNTLNTRVFRSSSKYVEYVLYMRFQRLGCGITRIRC